MNNNTHVFVLAKADGPDATLLRPSNWNAGHNPFLSKTNRSGATVNQYDYVVSDSANNDSFTTTTTASDTRVGFVVQDAAGIANNASGNVLPQGWDTTVNVQGNVLRGNWLVTSTTVGRLADSGVPGTSAPPTGSCAMSTSAYSGGGAGTVTAFITMQVGGNPIPSGTAMLFKQATAPTGWTRVVDAANTDAAIIIRQNSEVPGTGGTWTISGLTESGHTHDYSVTSFVDGTGSVAAYGRVNAGVWDFRNTGGAVSGNAISGTATSSTTPTIASSGAWRPKYVDVISATKN